MVGVTCDGLISYPEKGRNTSSHFMLQKPKIRIGLMSHLARMPLPYNLKPEDLICLCFFFLAIGGAAIVYGITPSQSIGSLGVTAPANDVTTAQAFVTELVLTYILIFAIFAVTDPSRGMTGYGVPLAIGITVFICLMHGVSTNYWYVA